MISLPHPYPDGEAEQYIVRQLTERENGRSVTFAIEQKVEGELIGLIEIRNINRLHSQAELSFWLIVEFWGQGHMSEVVQVIVQYGLEASVSTGFMHITCCETPFQDECLRKMASSKRGYCVSAYGSGENLRT